MKFLTALLATTLAAVMILASPGQGAISHDECPKVCVPVQNTTSVGVLPAGVVADASLASLRRCQHASPLTNEPVYSLNLGLRAGLT